MMNISMILNEKKAIENRLSKLVYGTIQLREENNNRYIYLYKRESGKLKSQYVGEYSNELHNLLMENNFLAKDLNKRLKSINKELKALNYIETELNEKVEQNIALAKRNMVDSIYKQSILEGIATTFSDTETLVNEGIVHNMKADDVTKTLNLKHAWEFILDKDVLQYATNYAILCQINYFVEEGLSPLNGRIRRLPVEIGGSTYVPPLPIENSIKEQLSDLLAKEKSVDNAIELILFVMKKQIFTDGNKRTAIIFGNHYLIQNGLGLIVVPAELVSEYKKLLIQYYEGKDLVSIKKILKDKCWKPIIL